MCPVPHQPPDPRAFFFVIFLLVQISFPHLSHCLHLGLCTFQAAADNYDTALTASYHLLPQSHVPSSALPESCLSFITQLPAVQTYGIVWTLCHHLILYNSLLKKWPVALHPWLGLQGFLAWPSLLGPIPGFSPACTGHQCSVTGTRLYFYLWISPPTLPPESALDFLPPTLNHPPISRQGLRETPSA